MNQVLITKATSETLTCTSLLEFSTCRRSGVHFSSWTENNKNWWRRSLTATCSLMALSRCWQALLIVIIFFTFFSKTKQNDNLLRDGTVEGNIAIMMVVIKKLMALIRVAIKIATKETMMTMWRWESSPSLMITEEDKICVFQSFSICQHWLSIFKGADDTDRKADSGSKSFSEILTE